MEKYRMGHSRNYLAAAITMMVGFSASAIIVAVFSGIFILSILMPVLIFMSDIVALFVIFYITYMRKTALTGKAQKAKVISLCSVEGLINEYEIIYQYKTDAGEDARGKAYIAGKDYEMFRRCRNIPVKVKGEYGAFVLEDVKKFFKEACAKKEAHEKACGNVNIDHGDINIEVDPSGKVKVNIKPQKKFIRCEYCGSNIKMNEAKCPNCGAPRPNV